MVQLNNFQASDISEWDWQVAAPPTVPKSESSFLALDINSKQIPMCHTTIKAIWVPFQITCPQAAFAVDNKGQGTRNINISTGDSDEISAIEDFWVASEYGTRSFVWVESPSSSPLSYLMNTEEPVLNFPLVGPIERNVAMVLLEQPPFKSSESW